MVKSELAKGIRKDSVLLGINFGDSRSEFYDKCIYLNKQKLVSNGMNGSVLYVFEDSLVHAKPTEIKLLFYPAFDKEDKITDIDILYSYTGWAPWNEKFQADSLKVKLMELFVKQYKGNEFVTATIDEKEVPVKVDGNRRILIYVKDTQSVQVKIQDIMHPKFMHSISGGKNMKGSKK